MLVQIAIVLNLQNKIDKVSNEDLLNNNNKIHFGGFDNFPNYVWGSGQLVVGGFHIWLCIVWLAMNGILFLAAHRKEYSGTKAATICPGPIFVQANVKTHNFLKTFHAI